MIKNYLTIAWRNLMKSKVFSFINIFGLTTGITVCMMIFLYVMHEFSVDDFHVNGKNIYRVMRSYDPSKPPAPYLSGPYAPALLNDFPGEIKQAVRVLPSNDLVVYKNRSFNEKKVYLADSNFFKVFTFPLIKGNPATALENPNSIVLTESTAKKYFGNEDPMGKIIEMDQKRELKVTGVAKDVPSNSHLDFDFVTPISYYAKMPFFKVWINNDNFTYVLLDEHANKASLEKRFPQFMQKYMGTDMQRLGSRFVLTLTPLKDIYFESASSFDPVRHGDKKVVYIFLSIAALILLIACINFMNLSTIRAAERSKEVGLRKVMGALRNNLVWQFMGESVLLTIISCILSIGLLQLLMPVYNSLLGYTIPVPYANWYLYAFLGGIIVVVGLLAGCYPALILSRFSPIEALKGKLKLGKGGSLFRQALVVVQFSITVFLITGTIIINKQMSYVKNKALGYNKEQTLIIPLDNNDIYNHMNDFKTGLQSNSNVTGVSMMSGEPGGFFDEHTFEAEGQDNRIWKSRTEFADFEFVKTLGLKIIAGRDFSPMHPTDTTSAVLINSTAAASLGFTPQQAIGKWVRNTVRDSARRYIIGVVADFNYTSLKENVEPLVISPAMDRRVAVVRLKAGALQSEIAAVKTAYTRAAPAYPFEYTFLDQKFGEMYKKDLKQQNILSIFSALAIVIACLGLFGLASFTAAKRTKEIGVRKVLGSSVQNIILLLSKDLLKPVLIAALIAIPVAYTVMNNWLQNFAYRTGLQWWVFAIAAGITVAIALFTVSFKAIKAAMANPTKSLRTE
ncbi:MAG TPA: ABC transporter permease [Chitinophagaceae bacterium]|nr:ABC transporter permease [Chitinophagaceae bacterium]